MATYSNMQFCIVAPLEVRVVKDPATGSVIVSVSDGPVGRFAFSGSADQVRAFVDDLAAKLREQAGTTEVRAVCNADLGHPCDTNDGQPCARCTEFLAREEHEHRRSYEAQKAFERATAELP